MSKSSEYILILGRYNHDIKEIQESGQFQVKYNASRSYTVQYSNRLDLNIEYMTVHKAKGTEADQVIFLNCNSGRYGFPSQIADDTILSLLLSKSDQFPNGEERRLFYVAMTRTRNQLNIIANKDIKSKFVVELEGKAGKVHENSCPWCGEGKLVPRAGKYGTFLGCSNFPDYCNYTERTSAKL